MMTMLQPIGFNPPNAGALVPALVPAMVPAMVPVSQALSAALPQAGMMVAQLPPPPMPVQPTGSPGPVLKNDVPFSLLEAQQYLDREWSQLGYGSVPPPRLIPLAAGETPCFIPHKLVTLTDWRAMTGSDTLPEGAAVKLNHEDKPAVELQNVILLPQEVMVKGRFPILAHEIHHAKAYPPVIAAMMAGWLPKPPELTIPKPYFRAIRESGLDRNPTVIRQGMYQSRVLTAAERNSDAFVPLIKEMDRMEAAGDTKSFRYERVARDYKHAMARYFTGPEELDAFILYSQLKGEPVMGQLFPALKTALQHRQPEAVSFFLDRLCEYGVAEGHVKGRQLPPLRPHEITGLLAEWDEIDRLKGQLGFQN